MPVSYILAQFLLKLRIQISCDSDEFEVIIRLWLCVVQFRRIVEVEPPSPLRYLIGAAIMMIGVVLPVGYMMFRNKRVPSTSSYSKQT